MVDYLVATDLHGSLEAAVKLKDTIAEEKPKKLILLGDILYHGPRNGLFSGYCPLEVSDVLKSIEIPILITKGNCDSEVDMMVTGMHFQKTLTLYSNGKKLLFCHGDKLKDAKFYADNGYIALFFGHTHVYNVTKEQGVTFINLSSLSLPKCGSPKSYAIIDKGEVIIKASPKIALSHIKL